MEILTPQSNKENNTNIDKRYVISVYVDRTLYAILEEYYSSLCLAGDESFKSVTDIMRAIFNKIKKDGYRKYIKSRPKQRKGIDYLNQYKNIAVIVERDLNKYWRSIPRGTKTQLFEIVLSKFLENKNFDY